MNNSEDKIPFKITSIDGFTNSLLIKGNNHNISESIFFRHSFTKRDILRGENPLLKRFNLSSEGLVINFTLREICEAFFDKYSGNTLANYFSKNSEQNESLTNLVDDLKFSDNFYTKAFVINLSSGGRGRWEYWQLYIPGLTNDEIANLIPKYLLSKSKYASNEIPQGYSPLLKKGIGKDYYHKLKQILGYKVTEKEYFLSKVTSSRNSAEDYYDYLKAQKPNNVDKTYLRFMKNWHSPIILIDNNKETDLPIHLDTLTVNESYVHSTYPIFDENYPIPDGGMLNPRPQNPGNTMLSLLESVYSLSERVLRGNFGLNTRND